MAKNWMIYGANGYTGRLAALEAKKRGHSPILAGRHAEAITALGKELGFETRVFDLESTKTVTENLKGMAAVLHCAGPFSKTHKPMFQACLRAKTHYLDVTGEIRVFERVQMMGRLIEEAGIVAMPGVGFDVVPSDCLAAMLKREMPEAKYLALAFKLEGRASPGTKKTLVEGLPMGGAVRQDGNIVLVGPAHKVRRIIFNKRPESAVAIPWGDVSTAFHSTGIPNIEVYIAMPELGINLLRCLRPIRILFALKPVQSFLKFLIEKSEKGESEAERAGQKTILWGEATDASGKKIEKRLKTPNGYELTADSAIRCMEKVLNGEVKPGAWTPSKAFGPDFILTLNGTALINS